MKTILVVDDDELLRSALVANLERLGFRVVNASDGARAVSLASDVVPDVVLLDLVMPNMDGIETLSEIRRLLPNTRIVVMSGSGYGRHPMYLEMSLALGAHATIQKPFTNEELIATIG